MFDNLYISVFLSVLCVILFLLVVLFVDILLLLFDIDLDV